MNIQELEIEKLESVANMLKAIAHPMRIAILGLLENGGKLTVSEIHQKLGIEQSSTFYSLRHENFAKIIECVGNCPLH